MTDRISSLTPEQTAEAHERYNQQLGMLCGPMNKKKLVALLKGYYKSQNVAPPRQTIVVGSPAAAAKVLGPNASSMLFLRSAGEEGWALNLYEFGEKAAGRPLYKDEDRNKLQLRKQMLLAARGAIVYCAREAIVIVEPPKEIHFDRTGYGVQSRLHNAKGPAVLWADGTKLYYYLGRKVDARFIETPESITIAEIQNEQNAETRRIMLSQYGEARYLQDTGAKSIDVDPVTRSELFVLKRRNDTDQHIVIVTNHTPEPEGVEPPPGCVRDSEGRFRRRFALKVPNTIRKANEAVAWTWGEKNIAIVQAT